MEPGRSEPQAATSARATWRWLAVLTLGYAVAVLAVLAGALDRLSGAGAIPRATALLSITLYWGLACAAVGVARLWRASRSQLGLVLGSVIVALLVFEAAVRALEIPAGMLQWRGIRSRTLHHGYPPNREMYAGSYEEARVFVRTNVDGLRSDYSREDFRRFPTRIALLGDSFTFGLGVRQEDTLPSRLEAILREQLGRDDLAVLNAGIVSYSPFLEGLLYGEVVSAYDPGLVLLVLDATDIGDDYKYTREAVAGDGEGSWVFPQAGPECGAETQVAYYGAVAEILRPLRGPLRYPFEVLQRRLRWGSGDCDYDYYDFQLKLGGAVETNRFFIYRHPIEQTRPYFEATLDNIRRVADAVKRSGASFALIVSPRFHHWNPEECPDNWEKDEYALDEPHQFEFLRFFERARDRVDFPIYSLLPAFQATDEFPLVLREDPHWNARGSDFVAREVARYLLDAQNSPVIGSPFLSRSSESNVRPGGLVLSEGAQGVGERRFNLP